MGDLNPQKETPAVEQAARGWAVRIRRTGELAVPALIAEREGLSLSQVEALGGERYGRLA